MLRAAVSHVGKMKTILVVDDEQSERQEIAESLRGAGYLVVEAENYEEAIAVAEANPGISFLVADVALPDGNGCALATALRQRIPELAVLFVSGHVGSEACRYYGLEVTDLHFLRKPFPPENLVGRVNRVVESGDWFPNLYVPKTWTSTGD
jgi:DNA-binding response OmpR family regulator